MFASTATVTGNVILDGNDIDPNTPRGTGINLLPDTGLVQVQNNIIAHDISSRPYGAGIYIDPAANNDIITNNIIYQWTGEAVRSTTTAPAIPYRPMRLTRPATSIQTAALDHTWPLSGALRLLPPFLPRPEIKVKAIGILNTLRMRSIAYIAAGFNITGRLARRSNCLVLD